MPRTAADPILNYMQGKSSEMLAMLRHFVEIESPSTDAAAVNRFGKSVGAALSQSGGKVFTHAGRTTGDHLEARFLDAARRHRGSEKSLLLLGHLDTVWSIGTLRNMPFRVAGGRAYGPGIFDMKAGVMIGIFALRCITDLKLPLRRPVTFLLNADEEIGSPASKPITQRLARQAAAAFVLEPSLGPQGALKTSRKGVGEYRLRVRGRAAHAGLDPRKGASAITELAHQLTTLQSFTDYSKGITLNPGMVRGGTRGNVVAAEAEAVIDVRVRDLADAERVDKLLRNLRPRDRRTHLLLSGGINRPPFERSAPGQELFTLASRLARPLGIKLRQAAAGGGSDGNFTAALGVPTLDGLGAVGDGAHAADEHILVSELPRRAALIAHLIAALASR